MKEELLNIINGLPKDERAVINLYYGINGVSAQHNIKAVAFLMKKSEKAIQRLKRKALMEIRKKFI